MNIQPRRRESSKVIPSISRGRDLHLSENERAQVFQNRRFLGLEKHWLRASTAEPRNLTRCLPFPQGASSLEYSRLPFQPHQPWLWPYRQVFPDTQERSLDRSL